MIYIGADKHGFDVIQFVEEWLNKNGMNYENIGVENKKQELPLENLLPPIAEKLNGDENNKAIVCCGTGIGVEVGINKFSGVRAALVDDPEAAGWATIYDKCNAICLIGWRKNRKKVFSILNSWFNTEYDGSKDRLKMFEEFNTWH
jgi:ribose 5-phosphate isomerase B